MTIQFEEECPVAFPFPYQELANRVIEASLDYSGCPYEVDLSLTLTSNEEIQKINQEYRTINFPTDVLSFPMVEFQTPGDFDFLEEDHFECFDPDTGELLLGDIVISVEKITQQAKEYGHSLEREFAFLVTHSMLHLMGYDHMEPEDASVMEAKQREILKILNITR